MSKIHVVCHRPGLIRGGHRNPPHAVHDIGFHTPEQLRELIAEPEITVISGDLLTEADIAAIEASPPKLAKKA